MRFSLDNPASDRVGILHAAVTRGEFVKARIALIPLQK